MTITPDQAQNLLDRATPGLWTRTTMGAIIDSAGKPLVHGPDGNMYDGDATLAAASPDLAQTIAGMTEVWAVEEQADDGGWWRITTWHMNREDLDSFHDRPGRRLVRRLVGPVEVAE